MKNAHTSRNIKELTDFLDNYNIKYEIVEDRVVADHLWLNNNNLTAESAESLEKMKSEGVDVEY